jgi:hypothetical protein
VVHFLLKQKPGRVDLGGRRIIKKIDQGRQEEEKDGKSLDTVTHGSPPAMRGRRNWSRFHEEAQHGLDVCPV